MAEVHVCGHIPDFFQFVFDNGKDNIAGAADKFNEAFSEALLQGKVAAAMAASTEGIPAAKVPLGKAKAPKSAPSDCTESGGEDDA